MATKKFGYVRVSTREQNPERQIHILRERGPAGGNGAEEVREELRRDL